MKIHKTMTVDASPDQVWRILGPDYANAGDWASSVFVSAARTDAAGLPGAPVAGRTCETSLRPFTESLVAYDEDNRHIAYSATGAKMPGFMRSLVNAWTVESVGPDRSSVTMELNADIAQPFALLMGWMMKKPFDGVLGETLDDLKVYAETGRPSARKVEADASEKGVAARAAVTA